MFVHLHVHTEYSFLDGGSSIEELVQQAALLGQPALAMTDHDSLSAAVKFHACCTGYGIKPLFGAEVTLSDGSHLTLIAKTRAGYANISRLLSLAYLHGGRLAPALPCEHIPAHAEGVICLSGCRKGKLARLILAHRFEDARRLAESLRDWFGSNLYLELQDDRTPHAKSLCQDLVLLSRHIGTQCVATNNVHYATPDGMIAHDIKQCIREGITIADEHASRPLNSQRYIKSAGEMAQLFAWHPQGVANSMLIAQQCDSDVLPLGEDIVPIYLTANGASHAEHLRTLAYEGARRRRAELSTVVKQRIDYEVDLLAQLGFVDIVLHAARGVRWACSEGITVTGRGSSADSEVCYDLFLTDIDPIARNLPVARWAAPGKVIDIDIDFDARRRDDVFRWFAKEYGEQNVAMCCTHF